MRIAHDGNFVPIDFRMGAEQFQSSKGICNPHFVQHVSDFEIMIIDAKTMKDDHSRDFLTVFFRHFQCAGNRDLLTLTFPCQYFPE